MRILIWLLITVVATSVPASAAGVDPKALVVVDMDLPGWQLDVDNSGPRSNKREADGDPELRAIFRRADRLGGYEAIYNRGSVEISSRADVFRKQNGADRFLEWFIQRVGASRTRSRVDLGAEGWTWAGLPAPAVGRFTLVVWRRGPIFAGIAAIGISQRRAISIARVQDRRIAAALR